MIRKAWHRFLEDCRDLWTLITKGGPEPLDELLPWKIMAEMAKQPIPQVDWFPEMCENYARHPTAFWNDWWLFDGEPWANPEPTPDERYRAQCRVMRVFGVEPPPHPLAREVHIPGSYSRIENNSIGQIGMQNAAFQSQLAQASSLMMAGVSLQSLSAQRMLGIL